MHTIGGGTVIDAEPQKHRRFRADVLKRLDDLASGDLGFWLQKLDEVELARLRDLEKLTGTSRQQLLQGLERLQESGQVELLAEQWVLSERVRSWQQQLPQLIRDYQQRHPLSSKLAPKGFEVLLEQMLGDGELVLRGELLATSDWQPQPTAEQERIIARLAEHFQAEGFAVKNCNEILKQLNLEGIDADLYFSYLVEEKTLKKLNQESYLHMKSYQRAEQLLIELFSAQPTLTLAQFRDRLGSGRKLTQALLEFFDSCKYTRRTGEERVAWQLPS